MSSHDRWDEGLSLWEAQCRQEGRDVAAREVWPDASPADLAELERRIENQRLMNNLAHPPAPPEERPSPDETLPVPGYVLEELLGKGGFGQVWKAKKVGDPNHPYVALKIVDLTQGKSQTEKTALEVMKDLHNTEIVPVSDAWQEGNRLFIEMELANDTLGGLLDKAKKHGYVGIDGQELFGFLTYAARGIDWLNEPRHTVHGRTGYRIFHCDIKPSNLLVFGRGVRVADFGVCQISQLTVTGSIAGKDARYAAPEFFGLEPKAYPQSDQYSLAVTYCELRGGRLPYRGDSPEEYANAHVRLPPDLTMLPEQERDIVRRALSKDPSDRFARCEEFVARLRGDKPAHVLRHSSLSSPHTAANLPEPTSYFTGRDAELEQLRGAFISESDARGPEIQVLSGLGGIGKTQLAMEYARRHRKDYQAAFWVRAESSADLLAGFARIAKSLGLPEGQEADQMRAVAAVRVWLENHRGWLLVLDNADKPQDIKSFLPRDADGHILITSRAQVFHVPIRNLLKVSKFPPQDAVRFLLKRTDREDADHTERGAAEELCREMYSLPLALEHAGAYLFIHLARFEDYLATWRTIRLKLLKKKVPIEGDYRHTVATTWKLNFDEVKKSSKAAADLLQVSALLHPDAIPLELLERGASQLGPALAKALSRYRDEPVVLDEVLEPLTRYSLIQRDQRSRTYSMHPLVQEVLVSAMRPNQRHCWVRRVVGAISAAFPSTDFKDWPLCERLLPHASCCARLVEEENFSSGEAGRVVGLTGHYLAQRGRFSQSEPLQWLALAISEKVLGPNHPDVAKSLNKLANLLNLQGRYAKALPLHERALAISERALGSDHPDVAKSLYDLARHLVERSRYGEALPLLERALAIREKASGPDHPDVADSLNNLASVLGDLGRDAEVLPLYERALAIYEKALGPDHPNVATGLNNLASVLGDLGRHAEALPLHERALTISEKALGPDHPHVAMSLNNLAELFGDLGRHAESLPLYERALAIREKALGPDHPDVAISLNTLANRLDDLGRHAEALPLHERAQAIRAKALGPEHPEAPSLGNSG
jgi:serine/threonine protein kinase